MDNSVYLLNRTIALRMLFVEGKEPKTTILPEEKGLPYYGYGDFIHSAIPGPEGGTDITYLSYEYPIYQDEYKVYVSVENLKEAVKKSVGM